MTHELLLLEAVLRIYDRNLIDRQGFQRLHHKNPNRLLSAFVFETWFGSSSADFSLVKLSTICGLSFLVNLVLGFCSSASSTYRFIIAGFFSSLRQVDLRSHRVYFFQCIHQMESIKRYWLASAWKPTTSSCLGDVNRPENRLFSIVSTFVCLMHLDSGPRFTPLSPSLRCRLIFPFSFAM